MLAGLQDLRTCVNFQYPVTLMEVAYQAAEHRQISERSSIDDDED